MVEKSQNIANRLLLRLVNFLGQPLQIGGLSKATTLATLGQHLTAELLRVVNYNIFAGQRQLQLLDTSPAPFLFTFG